MTTDFDDRLAELRAWRTAETAKKKGFTPEQVVSRLQRALEKMGRTDLKQWQQVLAAKLAPHQITELCEAMKQAAARLLLRADEL